jgi:hypothetical protein
MIDMGSTASHLASTQVRLALIFGADPALAHISELAHTAGFLRAKARRACG